MLSLIQFKSKSTFQGFVSTSYIGQVVSDDGKKIKLEKVCAVYEMLNADKRGDVQLVIKFYTNSILSNGSPEIKEEDILMRRAIAEDEEILDGYNSAFEAFRLDKIGLKRASNVKNVPEMRGQN